MLAVGPGTKKVRLILTRGFVLDLSVLGDVAVGEIAHGWRLAGRSAVSRWILTPADPQEDRTKNCRAWGMAQDYAERTRPEPGAVWAIQLPRPLFRTLRVSANVSSGPRKTKGFRVMMAAGYRWGRGSLAEAATPWQNSVS